MPQNEKQRVEANPEPRWEQTPWLAQERVVDEPEARAAEPLRLCDEHVVDVPLDGDAIVRA